jgi:catechol 2,3-dioxygenase-like lactoylglutathione lyase family enzyme
VEKYMKITNLDHFVLTVKNLNKTVHFYCDVLGMEKEVFEDGRIALKYGNQKINLHQVGNEFEPKAANSIPGSADMCFVTKTELKIAMRRVRDKGIEIIEGPVTRAGAKGLIESFYFRDPDENLIEVSNYKITT